MRLVVPLATVDSAMVRSNVVDFKLHRGCPAPWCLSFTRNLLNSWLRMVLIFSPPSCSQGPLLLHKALLFQATWSYPQQPAPHRRSSSPILKYLKVFHLRTPTQTFEDKVVSPPTPLKINLLKDE